MLNGGRGVEGRSRFWSTSYFAMSLHCICRKKYFLKSRHLQLFTKLHLSLEFSSLNAELNSSIPQFLNSSIPQFLDSSIPQFLNSSIPQFLDSSIPRFLKSSIHQFINSSIHQFINSSIHPVMWIRIDHIRIRIRINKI